MVGILAGTYHLYLLHAFTGKCLTRRNQNRLLSTAPLNLTFSHCLLRNLYFHIFGHVFHCCTWDAIPVLQSAYPYSVQFTLICRLFERRLEGGMTSYSIRFYLQSVI